MGRKEPGDGRGVHDGYGVSPEALREACIDDDIGELLNAASWSRPHGNC